LAIGTKRNINEIVKGHPLNMNGFNTILDSNIFSLGSYGVLIGMDWLDAHHVGLDCHNNIFICLDEEGQYKTVKEFSRPISMREISSLQ